MKRVDDQALRLNQFIKFVHVTCGGFLALRRSLCHTGGIEGAHTPRAISPMAFMN